MNPAALGSFVGLIVFSALVPALILIVLKLIPATRTKHGMAYGIAGTVAVLTTWLTPDHLASAMASLILAGIFLLGYLRARRTVKK